MKFRSSTLAITVLAAAVATPACDPRADSRVPRLEGDAPAAAGDAGSAGAVRAGGGADAGEAPPRARAGAPCVLSADCAAGLHCDLGECVQACNADSACEEGLSCSARGRCLAPGEADTDPPPPTERAGTLGVDVAAVRLTERNDVLQLHLESDSADPVRYRVELSAPHLSIAEPRGEFTGNTLLELGVSSSGLAGNVPGSIRILSNLGSLVVDAPIRVGLSGVYDGAMTYSGEGLSLGTAALSLDLVEEGGAVRVRIRPETSLLFPGTIDDPVTGFGQYTLADGVSLAIAHVVPPETGGDRNHFRRPLGREITMDLLPGRRGVLEGKFKEWLHGVREEPIRLEGTVYLAPRSGDMPLRFEVPGPPAMPVPDLTPPDIATAFANWTEADCGSIQHDENVAGRAFEVVLGNHLPLDVLLSGLGTADSSIGHVAALCAADLVAGPLPPLVAPDCASPQRLACALRDVAAIDERSDELSKMFATLYYAMLDPALVVAQDRLVEGARASFRDGMAAEDRALDAAREALRGVTAWALHPAALSYLSRVIDADVDAGVDANSAEDVPSHERALRALRTLVRLFFVHATIDDEASALSAADRERPLEKRARDAQERALIALFEASVFTAVVEAWKDAAPPDVGVEFTDVLTPFDRAFRALRDGELVFGVPSGSVPRIAKPGDVSSNFDQMLHAQARTLALFQENEDTFLAAGREHEQNQGLLEAELDGVKAGIEGEIKTICGDDFDFVNADTDEEWAECGAEGVGEVAQATLAVKAAEDRLRAAQSRADGMGKKIEIEERRMRDVAKIHRATVRFISDTGQELQTLARNEAHINAAQKAMELASEASLTNAFAPVAGIGVAVALEEARGAINERRQELQTAQDVKIQTASAEAEVTNSAATVKSMAVDQAQLALEATQEVTGILQARLGMINAVQRARHLVTDRARALDRLARSSLRDPTYRIVESRTALLALRARAEAKRGLYRAGRALEYELNQPFGDALGKAVFNVHGAAQARQLAACLDTIATDGLLEHGAPQTYSTELSLRKVLGITADRVDEVTGELLTAGEQFRRALLTNDQFDGRGGVGVQFSSNLEPGGLWPSNVCNDRIVSVEAQIVGDFLGDEDAQVELSLEGGGVLRRCDQETLVNWATTDLAVLQAGVNHFGSAGPNTSLKGLSVASSLFRVHLTSSLDAPANSDVDPSRVDDVVLRIRHEALPLRGASSPIPLDCLASVGAGG